MNAEIWTYHRGLDYAVVMRPREDTSSAAISITADPEDADTLGAKISALPDLLAAAKLLEEAESAHANCEACEGLGVPELCGECFPHFYKARVARRNAIAKAESAQ